MRHALLPAHLSPRQGIALLLPCLLALALGCGGGGNQRVAVSGNVQFDGQPVDGGNIIFAPVGEGRVRTNGPIIGGKFDLPAEQGPQPGPYKVEIYWPKKTGRKLPDPANPNDPEFMREETVEQIPAKYNKTTELTWDVTSGPNTKDFDLKK